MAGFEHLNANDFAGDVAALVKRGDLDAGARAMRSVVDQLRLELTRHVSAELVQWQLVDELLEAARELAISIRLLASQRG